jgi:hypothetical protein
VRWLLVLLLTGCTYVSVEGDGNAVSPTVDTDTAVGGVSGSSIDLDAEVTKKENEDE